MRTFLPILVGVAVTASAFGRAGKPQLPQPARQQAQDTPRPANSPVPATATVNELIAGLKSPDVLKRRQAASALGHRGSLAVAAVPALVAVLKDDPVPTVRSQAAAALGGIGILAKAAVPDLLNALKDGDALVRETAAEALADIRVDAPKVVPALVALLSDKEIDVRCAAAASLGDFGAAAQSAVEDLKKAHKDKHPFVSEAAGDALKAIDRAVRRIGS
jgi:HEAT repeat protein